MIEVCPYRIKRKVGTFPKCKYCRSIGRIDFSECRLGCPLKLLCIGYNPVDDIDISVLHLPHADGCDRAGYVSARHDSDSLSDLVVPFGNKTLVVDNL